jgi:hypothetical protein
MEKEFSLDGVAIKLSADNLSAEIVEQAKALVKGRWEFSNVKNSIEFVKDWNALQEKGRGKKLDFCEYQRKLCELLEYRHSKFAEFGYATEREIKESFTDKYGEEFNSTIKVGEPIDELPSLHLTEAYRLLGFQSKFSEDILKRFIVAEKKHKPLTDYENPEQLVSYLRTLDLNEDKNAVSEFIQALRQTAERFSGKFVTEVGEALHNLTLKSLEEIKADYDKKATDVPDVEGMIIDSEITDMTLTRYLDAIVEKTIYFSRFSEMTPEEQEHANKLRDLPSFKTEKDALAYAKEIAERSGKSIEYKIHNDNGLFKVEVI